MGPKWAKPALRPFRAEAVQKVARIRLAGHVSLHASPKICEDEELPCEGPRSAPFALLMLPVLPWPAATDRYFVLQHCVRPPLRASNT